MSPDRISDRLSDAIATLDYVVICLDNDPTGASEINNVVRDLADLKLEIEREAFITGKP